MTKEKALETIERLYKGNGGEFDEAVKSFNKIVVLPEDFWRINFDYINNKMLSKYPALYYGNII